MLARAFSQQAVAVPSKASGSSGFDRMSTPFFLQGCRVDANADTPKALPAHDISLASNEPFLPTGRRLASVPSQRLLTRARSARQRSFSNETRTACVTWRALLKVFCWTPLSRLPPRCFAPIAQRGNAHRSITPPARHHRNPKRRNSGALVPYTCRSMRGKNGTVDAHGASSQAIKQPNNQATKQPCRGVKGPLSMIAPHNLHLNRFTSSIQHSYKPSAPFGYSTPRLTPSYLYFILPIDFPNPNSPWIHPIWKSSRSSKSRAI